MTMHVLTLAELNKLDGGVVALAFEQAMERAIADCEDRPGEEKPRKVNLQCELVPVRDGETGGLDTIAFVYQVKDTVPTRKSRVFNGAVRVTGGQRRLVYSDESPGNVHQRSIFDQDETDEIQGVD